MITEIGKRRATKIIAWSSWLTALALTVWISFQPITSTARQFSLVIIFLIGVGIVSGLAMSRFKLTDTIVAALQTGYELSEENAKKRVVSHEANADDRMQAHEDWIEQR